PAKFTDFYEQVTWMSVQRHLKIIGIFCRLTLRDGKSKYLAELPRFLGYLQRIAGDIPELYPLFRLIKSLDTPT
ncbi:MAG: aminoglycoside phosphotransferase, partial [Gammaproteobacteria bacterium]|nr:aminoglycoside phosphotransferase [Gammaproteobacteria bacterium]